MPPFELQVTSRRLLRGGQAERLGSRALDVLVVLAGAGLAAVACERARAATAFRVADRLAARHAPGDRPVEAARSQGKAVSLPAALFAADDRWAANASR